MQLVTDASLVRDTGNTGIAAKNELSALWRTPEELANIASQFASSDGWIGCGCAPNIAGMSGYIKIPTTTFGNQLATRAINRFPRPR